MDNKTLGMIVALGGSGSGGGGSLVPVPSAQDIGKIIEVISDGGSGAEYGLISLASPMVFKGTLGVGGDIQSLPTASSSNEGFTYLVITDGTYASQAAKAGDMFISNGSAWSYVPAGDEPTPLVISDTLTAGSTQITFSNAAITADSLIDVYAPVWYSDVVQSAGSVVITFPVQTSDITVSIKVS